MAAAAATDGPHAAARRPTVLVVEDEVLVRLTIADDLRARGLTVVEAAGADEALAILQGDIPVDLLFTDVQMPGSMDGLQLAELARTLRPDLKIFITSGNAPERSSSAPADAFFDKPYDVDSVVTHIAASFGAGEE